MSRKTFRFVLMVAIVLVSLVVGLARFLSNLRCINGKNPFLNPLYFVFVNFHDFRYEYLWADGETIKKPIKVSAPDYVDYLMTWVQSILDDETVFPSRVGMPIYDSL